VVLSSPSGAGKTSIARGVVARDDGVRYSISATTRPLRPGEKNGQDYYFYRPARFRAELKAGRLLETAHVYGYEYGTPKLPITRALKQGRDVIADLDIQGARSLKKLIPGTVTIFVTAPNERELRRRLHERKTDSPPEIRKRRACIAAELKAMSGFDYLVINQSLDRAIADVLAIIRAERLRMPRKELNESSIHAD
jgi:guanylate kinase